MGATLMADNGTRIPRMNGQKEHVEDQKTYLSHLPGSVSLRPWAVQAWCREALWQVADARGPSVKAGGHHPIRSGVDSLYCVEVSSNDDVNSLVAC